MVHSLFQSTKSFYKRLTSKQDEEHGRIKAEAKQGLTLNKAISEAQIEER